MFAGVTSAAAAAFVSSRSVSCKNFRKPPYLLSKLSRLASARWLARPPGLRREAPGRHASSHAHRSALGHSFGTGDSGRLLWRLRVVIQMLHDDLAEDFACLNGLQANVSADGRAHVSMTENSSNQLIFARSAHQNDGASRMPKLMCRYSQSCRFKDALGDLAA